MENENEIQDAIKLRLTPIAENYLLTATRWAKFVSIIGFIASGFMLIASFSIGTVMSIIAAANPMGAAGFPVVLLSVMYIVMSGVYFLGALFIYNFAVKSQRSIKLREEYSLEGGMKGIKNYFLILGILVIVMLSMIALMIFVGIIAGLTAAF